MGLILSGQEGEEFIFSIQVPSSFAKLPPAQFPSSEHIRAVRELERSSVQLSGLQPGRYHTLDSETFECVRQVYDHLVDTLLEQLSGLDVAELCVALYTRLEEFLGDMHKRRFERIPNLMLAGYSESRNPLDSIWLKISPYTESIRWLIEICLKTCQYTGTPVSASQVDRLMEIAKLILTWDTAWDQVHHGVLSYEFVISEDFSASSRPTPAALASIQQYRRAMAPWQIESEREWMDIVLPQRENTEASENEWFELLDSPMTTELGYNMNDWGRYYQGLLDSFDWEEYIKVISKEELSEHLAQKWQIEQTQFSSLLFDHALSQQTVAEHSLDALRPGKLAQRDSRVFRRPVVLTSSRDVSPLCIYGIESVWATAMRFAGNFIGGQFSIQRLRRDGPVMKTIGRIRTNLGDVLRDRIAAECEELKYEIQKEKNSIGVEQIPNSAGFGPIDVFLVDRKFNRFVLIETKDTDDSGMTPNKTWAELNEYRRYVQKLHRQRKWFEDRVNSLKLEFGIDVNESYEVVGVIVINRPRLWMFTSFENYPIVADKTFLSLLRNGGEFVTST